MDFLRLLAAGRCGALDTFFSGLTYFGSEIAFMAAALLIFWCVDKRQGYYVFLVGALGTVCNQFLKLAFRIPRPWVLDPDFQIVEAARADATGYSFPSGHTQNIVGTSASIFASRKETWVRIVCIVLMVLVPFSRMYLGVHTPLDVGVAFLTALALAAALYPAFRTESAAKKDSAVAFTWRGGAVRRISDLRLVPRPVRLAGGQRRPFQYHARPQKRVHHAGRAAGLSDRVHCRREKAAF
ncbi:MAG: phosphatase PAP2 family protein [Oscillospiraceae bacterium]